MPKKIRHACRFLAGNEKIASYLGAIERNAELLMDARRVLPTPLDEHCLHATLDAGVLTLITDSPVWSSRLRFFAPEIERGLAPRHGTIFQCRVRVQPPATKPKPHTAPGYKLSKKTVQHLIDAAEGIEDTELGAALRQLAKTAAARD